jgi:hypothetical protein
MGEYVDKLPERIREHILSLVGPSGLADDPDAEELLAQGWVEKHEAFERHTAERGMVGVESFPADDPRGALIMTFSGSILSVGPIFEGNREIAYASIGVRRDVPQMSVRQDSALADMVKKDSPVTMITGPVARTSPVYAIAVFEGALEPYKENAALVEVTQVLTKQFVDINRSTLD